MGNYKLTVCYETVTPESAELGDVADRGVYDVIEFDHFDDLIREIEQHGSIEPSCSAFTRDIWYTQIDAPDKDYETGAETRLSFHLDRETPVYLQRLAYRVLTGKHPGPRGVNAAEYVEEKSTGQ